MWRWGPGGNKYAIVCIELCYVSNVHSALSRYIVAFMHNVLANVRYMSRYRYCCFSEYTCEAALGFPGVYPWAAARNARGGQAAGWAINEPLSGFEPLPVDGEEAVVDEVVDSHLCDVEQVAFDDLAGLLVYVHVSHSNVSFLFCLMSVAASYASGNFDL